MTTRSYLYLAIPLIISTITVPLLGAVDTAVVGQIPNPVYIGGIAVGTVIFNTMYWLFGFLRVSTSGFAAQAHGANDSTRMAKSFYQPIILAFCIGVIFILLQKPILYFAQLFLGVTGDVKQISADYYNIRIWGAPFTLMNYVIVGWLLGMAKIKWTVFIQVLMNVLNMILAYLFVIVFPFQTAGVASATLIAEITAFILGVVILAKTDQLKGTFSFLSSWGGMLEGTQIKKMFIVNRDLFIRTICLLIVFNTFTAKGTAYGTEVLAANAILIQIHYIMAYFYDGLANASSIITGRAVGQKNNELYAFSVKMSFIWSILFSAVITAVFLLFRTEILSFFTVSEEVLAIGEEYSLWLALFPICASFGLVFYGIFTGATEVGYVRNSMIGAVTLFFVVLFPAADSWGNHGLWLAFIIFSLARSILLLLYMPKLAQRFTAFLNKDVKT